MYISPNLTLDIVVYGLDRVAKKGTAAENLEF